MTNIIIFGTSTVGERVFEIISLLRQYDVVAWTDNDAKKWGKIKYGKPIVPVEKLKEYKDAKIVIGSSYFMEIGKQLEEMGIFEFYEDIHLLISELSEEERFMLRENLSAVVLSKVNPDYSLFELDKIQINKDENKKTYLVICNGGYPSEEDAFQGCTFVHRRIKYYQKAGLDIEVYAYKKNASFKVDEFDSVKVYRGDFWGMVALLKQKKYEKIMVHFMVQKFWQAFKKANVLDVPMIIWCHGAEIERWHISWYNYTAEEIEKNKNNYEREDRERHNLFMDLFSKENIQFVFVSKWLKNKVYQTFGTLPLHYEVIHNIVDSSLFPYFEKKAEDRKKIISIKSHNERRYANDITAKAIEELSKRECFNKLEIFLAGDGIYFDENFKELKERQFTNVRIEKKFFNQQELSELYSEYGILLSPTRSDSQGVTNGEGMSMGMNVISCNTAAVPEFLDEECALLYEYDNYMQIADQIEFLYNHPEEFLRKSRLAVERVRKQCGYDNTVAKEIDLIVE